MLAWGHNHTPETNKFPISKGDKVACMTSHWWPWKLWSNWLLSTSQSAHVESPDAVKICQIIQHLKHEDEKKALYGLCKPDDRTEWMNKMICNLYAWQLLFVEMVHLQFQVQYFLLVCSRQLRLRKLDRTKIQVERLNIYYQGHWIKKHLNTFFITSKNMK